MNIRPVSDLRNRYPEVEAELKRAGAVYLTKNGYGTAVLIEISKYLELTGEALQESVPATPTEHYRGLLHKYADANLAAKEKQAGTLHAKKKYGGKEEVRR